MYKMEVMIKMDITLQGCLGLNDMPLENSEQCVAYAKSSANVTYCYDLTLCTHYMASEKCQQTLMHA